MSSKSTEETLWIVWNGEEVAGVMAYGFWPGATGPALHPPRELWPGGTEFRATRLTGDDWLVVLWTIRVHRWPEPDKWQGIVRETLGALTAGGARVAWCGMEGYFADPPSLFDPGEMSGGVWAALSQPTGFVCTAQIGEPFAPVSDELLLELRAAPG